MHTLHRESSAFSLFRVRDMRPGAWCRIEWVTLREKLPDQRLPDLGPCRYAWEALQMATLEAGLEWWMTADGKLIIAPPGK